MRNWFPIVAAALVGCDSSPSVLHGDVYLVMQSGDTKKGAGRQVYLIANPDSVELRIRAICATVGEGAIKAAEQSERLMTEARELTDRAESAMGGGSGLGVAFARRALDSAQKMTTRAGTLLSRGKILADSALLLVGLTLSHAAVDSAASGVNAHYRFANARPGKYALYLQWTIGENDYRWWAPVTVATGDSVRKDLDNKSEAGSALTCGLQDE